MKRRISLQTTRDAVCMVYKVASRTPLVCLEPPPQADSTRAESTEIFLKLEMLQPTGSFKIRGTPSTRSGNSRPGSSRTACGP